MPTTQEYVDQGWAAFLVGASGHALESGAQVAFNSRFYDSVDYKRTHHPKWLQTEGAAQGEFLANMTGQIAAILAGTSPISGTDINAAANAVRDSQETPSGFC